MLFKYKLSVFVICLCAIASVVTMGFTIFGNNSHEQIIAEAITWIMLVIAFAYVSLEKEKSKPEVRYALREEAKEKAMFEESLKSMTDKEREEALGEVWKYLKSSIKNKYNRRK